MTKIDHKCDESCRKSNPLADIGTLLRAMDDARGQIEHYSRIIDSLKSLELDLYEDEAVSSFINARPRYQATLSALKRNYEQLTK